MGNIMSTLNEMKQGEKCVIREIAVSGITLQRLVSLGFTPGEEAVVVRRAPFLDPFDVMVCGSKVAIRENEAKQIKVEVL